METVLITGASRGIGLELSRQFLHLGSRVIATYRGQASAALEALKATGELSLYPLEVTDPEAIASLQEQLKATRLDILINNAGIKGDEHQNLDDSDPQQWLKVFEVNTISPFLVSRAFIPNLKQSANPRIITVSSQMGALSHTGTGMYAYRSSKAATNKVMHTLSQELGPLGFCVNPIHPGWVKTDMGGDNAELTVEQSVTGIVKLIQGLTSERNGTFYNWDGSVHQW
ncbi:SDR family oxidoreductase [Alginatibacterium sediminis]|uniref:SDR family oxidoreductase n=1 Tax=Alginatibacterium sediminis TaxID=2164068 RepID=A0A420EBC1_9ALTE|nr:SDR family oxidoreductase [Alginatibacterium sediminis]RKF17976.1 SDR family oxidoreductase [Alginatibacterium sediminis]